MLCLSQWIMPDGIDYLVDCCKCSALLCDGSLDDESPFRKLLLKRPLIKQCIVPSLNDWLYPGDSVARYPYTKNWDTTADDPVVICHTSGTTGNGDFSYYKISIR